MRRKLLLPLLLLTSLLAVAQTAPQSKRPFTFEELRSAREAFLTSTTSHVLPVTRVDGELVGDGKPGRIARRLRELYTAELGRA